MLIKSSFGPQFKEYAIGNIVKLAKKEPLALTSNFEVSEETLTFLT